MKKRNGLALFGVLAVLLTGCGADEELQARLDAGMTNIENGAYEKALTDFSEVIQGGELLVEAYRGTGMAYMAMGEYGQAVDAFDQALALTDDRMRETEKDILYYKAAAQYQGEDYAGASETCDQILVLANEGNAHYIKGASCMKLGDTSTAKTEFDTAASLNADDYDMLLDIYECYREQNLSAEGDTYLQQALNIQGSDGNTAYQKARIYYYLEEYDKAQALLSASADSLDLEGRLLLGEIYLAMDDTDHARMTYQSCIEEYGETPQCVNGLVLCDIADGDYASALENADRGLALDGEEGKQDLAYNAIVALEYQGDFDGALERAASYVEQYPEDEKGQKEYAFLLSR